MYEWLGNIFGWLFRRGESYRADFESVVDRWKGLYDSIDERLKFVEALMVKLHDDLEVEKERNAKCEAARMRDKVVIQGLRKRIEYLEEDHG